MHGHLLRRDGHLLEYYGILVKSVPLLVSCKPVSGQFIHACMQGLILKINVFFLPYPAQW